MTTFRCLIVDDERPSLQLLGAYLRKLPHLELVASCEDAMTAMAQLQTQPIDILFCDIQMPEFTGLDLLRMLKQSPQVILTTAYRDYAVEGFELEVTDYLLKPFSFERFVQAVNKAIHQLTPVQAPPSPSLPANEEDAGNYFFARTNHKLEQVHLADILYVESMREYSNLHTSARRYVLSTSMQKLSEELPQNRFMRIHRSYIISLHHIQSVKGNMVVVGDKDIPIGASYRKSFFECLKLL